MKIRTKTVKDRYGEYTASTIKLSEDGVVYEVLLDKYISLMSKLFDSDKYKKKKTYNSQMQMFLDDLDKKFTDNGKKRSYPGCGSYKTFERCFDKVITKKNGQVSDVDEKRCIHILRDVGSFFETELLSNPEESLHKKNEYIHSLVLPLVDIMVKSDFFYYIPYTTKALGYQCYWNHMKMIENNIEILFKENCEMFKLWQEILEPMRLIIGNGNDEDNYPGGDFPGIASKRWLDANPNLKYFDCVYDVAEKDYQLYKDIKAGKYGKIHFCFDIGKNEFEVKENIKKRKVYFRENRIKEDFKINFEREKQVFFKEFRKAYLKIVEQEMNIGCV